MTEEVVHIKTDGINVPDGIPDTCQCVWNHHREELPLFFHTMYQCRAERAADSNRFCRGCEDDHGKAWRDANEAARAEAGDA